MIQAKNLFKHRKFPKIFFFYYTVPGCKKSRCCALGFHYCILPLFFNCIPA